MINLEKLSLRLRIFLFFALIALASCVIIVAALYFALGRIGPDALPHLVLFGGLACFGIMFITGWVWQKFDHHVAAPIKLMVKDIRSLVHADAPQKIDQETGKYLGFLNPAITEISNALIQARTETDNQISDAVDNANKQKRRLESVLKDLDQGVLICNLEHKILLYNHRALQILHVSGELGLGRSLFSVVSAAPFRHALERLDHRLKENRHTRHNDGLSQLIIGTTADGSHTLQGRVSLLINDDDRTPNGFMVSFEDITRQLADNVERDRLLHNALIELRHPAANLQATAEMLAGDFKLDATTRKSLEQMIASETTKLSKKLEELDSQSHQMLASAWPMSDVYSSSLFHSILRRNSAEDVTVTCEFIGEPVWLHCDSVTIVELIEYILRKISKDTGHRAFQLKATQTGRKIYIDLHWHGDQALTVAQINSWLDEPLDPDLGSITGRDVLDRHKSDFWCVKIPRGTVHLRLPLKTARDHHSDNPMEFQSQTIPQRPEFYDFDLMEQRHLGSMEDTPLRELNFVVFDTETTGLDPSKDEMISIAGVRIVNGRIMSGEVFDHYINPGRTIPPASTQVHHITNQMVADAPAATTVLPKFQSFVSDAVLVAHNAAFDMKFLSLKQDETGVTFTNPVLDTVLLAAHLQGQSSSLTLDTLAEQFGIEIPVDVRHTALGDSIATAKLLLCLIDLLEASGITTLRGAVEAEKKMAAIRRKQAQY
ncbi:exonuclease domain-containing protein [Cohaesibacter celericrescens]|uniref:DNA-directed DNA polymerase n=1 Tax=Cohaesibacter celericrescens TaxID=2067669 RepID=A0A2N5XM74_9HYPH|nr:exonuclease domain-containing protein [Cohaesibacter celericrescens]PLW75619.1 exonuclease [Cohaesibacter celericrescens]